MNASTSIEPADVARFAAMADEWWNPTGKFAPLHQLNPARLGVIRDICVNRFGRHGRGRTPFAGLRLLDIGCGGGLVAEPMTRLGFDVTAVDAAAEGVAAAGLHAQGAGLAIDYREATVEALVAAGEPPFDVVLALEVVEHVADAGVFLADCARLLAPGGVIIVATLNRTLRSLALAKVVAEYVLRWAPAGTHDWRKFLTPQTLDGLLSRAGLTVERPVGLAFDPVNGVWRRSADISVNFMIAAARLTSPQL
jgi:2-polyprenyl-6-hydroxyphenyl methylase/3-demethylubiquinone-9 3-methyltransferase